MLGIAEVFQKLKNSTNKRQNQVSFMDLTKKFVKQFYQGIRKCDFHVPYIDIQILNTNIVGTLHFLEFTADIEMRVGSTFQFVAVFCDSLC